jgi:hypothetical protein
MVEHEFLLDRHAKAEPENIGRQRVDLLELGEQRLAFQETMAVPDDSQIGIGPAQRGDGALVFLGFRAEEIEAGACLACEAGLRQRKREANTNGWPSARIWSAARKSLASSGSRLARAIASPLTEVK